LYDADPASLMIAKERETMDFNAKIDLLAASKAVQVYWAWLEALPRPTAYEMGTRHQSDMDFLWSEAKRLHPVT
jgi:hypothetical protein